MVKLSQIFLIILISKKKIIENLTQDYNNYDKSEELFFENLIPKSFSANKDFVSDIIQLNENISYIFNVTNIVLATPLKFDTIENIILKDWKIHKKIEKIKLEVDDNKNNNSFLSNLSSKQDLNIKQISITQNSNELPRNFINHIFQSEVGQNIENINENKFYIGRINDIIIPNKKIDSEIYLITNDLRASFGEELKKYKKISINDNLINAIINQY